MASRASTSNACTRCYLLKKSATPKNLSNCQRAMSHAEAFDVFPQMRAGVHARSPSNGVTCCPARSWVGEYTGSFQAVKLREPSRGGTAFKSSLSAQVFGHYSKQCRVPLVWLRSAIRRTSVATQNSLSTAWPPSVEKLSPIH